MAMMQTLIYKAGNDAAGEPLYRWRSRDAQGVWLHAVQSGSRQALQEAAAGSRVTLLLAGSDVAIAAMQLSKAELRHLDKLVPYELEEDLLVAPDAIHVASGPAEEDATLVAYTDRDALAAELAAWQALGIDIVHCVPFPLLLPRPEQGWTLALVQEQLHVHAGRGRCLSVDMALAPLALQQLASEIEPPAQIDLRAAQAAEMQALQQLVTDWLPTLPSPPELRQRLAPLWDELLDPDGCPLDLLQGPLARRLPWQRWWQYSRPIAALAAVALFAWIGVQWVQIQMLDQRYRAVDEQITAVYRDVVPEGVLVNAEQQLQAQVAKLEGSGSEGVLVLLSELAPLLVNQSEMVITRLDYNAPRQELQLSLSAQRNGDILAFTDAIQALGLEAQAQGFSRQGQSQLANVLITESRQ